MVKLAWWTQSIDPDQIASSSVSALFAQTCLSEYFRSLRSFQGFQVKSLGQKKKKFGLIG